MIFNFGQSFVRMVHVGRWSGQDRPFPGFFQKLENETYFVPCLGMLVFMDGGRPGDQF